MCDAAIPVEGSIMVFRGKIRGKMRHKVYLSCPSCGAELHGYGKGITHYLCGGKHYKQQVEGKWVEVVECEHKEIL